MAAAENMGVAIRAAHLWLNGRLKRQGLHCYEFSRDLNDGILLHKLLEAEESPSAEAGPAIATFGELRYDVGSRASNLRILLRYLESRGVLCGTLESVIDNIARLGERSGGARGRHRSRRREKGGSSAGGEMSNSPSQSPIPRSNSMEMLVKSAYSLEGHNSAGTRAARLRNGSQSFEEFGDDGGDGASSSRSYSSSSSGDGSSSSSRSSSDESDDGEFPILLLVWKVRSSSVSSLRRARASNRCDLSGATDSKAVGPGKLTRLSLDCLDHIRFLSTCAAARHCSENRYKSNPRPSPLRCSCGSSTRLL